MDWQRYRDRLPNHLDEMGDLPPPWEKFPHFEHNSMGWRMGDGEDWLRLWHLFLEQLGPGFEVRLAYLRRHPPAPVVWAASVYHALYSQSGREPKPEDDDVAEALVAERRDSLLKQGLLASDIAYPTWLRQQRGIVWPWAYERTARKTARHYRRELWFWSRQIAGLREGPSWAPPKVPVGWRSCASALETGKVGRLDLRQGLISLAQMLSAGRVQPPWQLGLELSDFADSFENDMGYVDAFRLWGQSVFDDLQQLRLYLDATQVTPDWEAWAQDQFLFDLRTTWGWFAPSRRKKS